MASSAPKTISESNGKLSPDGNTIEGVWKLSRDDSTWDNDLAITFRADSQRPPTRIRSS
jgi:hypothetical protein